MNSLIKQTSIIKDFEVNVDPKKLEPIHSVGELEAGSVLVIKIGRQRFNAYEIIIRELKRVVLKNLLGRNKGNQYEYEKTDFDTRFRSSKKFEFVCN